MSVHGCGCCKQVYKKMTNMPILLSCGDIICSKCISFFTYGLNKDEFECPICCDNIKSTKIEIKNLYPKDIISIISSQNHAPKEFEIFIKFLNGEKYSTKVTKELTIEQLKSKISKETGIDLRQKELIYKRPLNNRQTLEFYGIKNSVTIMEISSVIGGAQ